VGVIYAAKPGKVRFTAHKVKVLLDLAENLPTKILDTFGDLR